MVTRRTSEGWVTQALLDTALYHHSEGRPVIGVNPEKKPYRAGWNQYFERRQTEAEVRREFSNGGHGIAMVLYPACGNAMLDFDGEHADAAWQSTRIELPQT